MSQLTFAKLKWITKMNLFLNVILEAISHLLFLTWPGNKHLFR